MRAVELRAKFLKYFREKGHTVLPSASLVPENDPTVLFNVAGMQPLVRYLLGEKHPGGEKLANIQKCIRTIDIDDVGDKTHNTFFEMLGYWSLGAYWKREAIGFTFEFLTKELNINVENLAITCFAGEPENDIPKDLESFEIWREHGIPEERIAFLGREDNFWGPAGTEGPCGPDTEIFVWTGDEDAPEIYDPNDKKWVEIGNDVFMQYNKTKDGKYQPLAQKNVDFGAGFERLLMILNGCDEVYLTDLFLPLLGEIEGISGKKYTENSKEFRIIADHIRAAVFMIDDGVAPSNKERGYILRRLIRRAVVKGQQLGIAENFTTKVARKVFEIYEGAYFTAVIPAEAGIQSGLATKPSGSQITRLAFGLPGRKSGMTNIILDELEKEETKFRQTLKEGLKILESKKEVSGKDLFDLYQSFGLPLEISVEELERRNIPINNLTIEQFNNELREHQEKSRTASAGMFKGGLADAGEITTKYHTVTHLLLAALRQVLGDQVFQKGSNITAERMRFDFSYPDKMTPEQVKEVEDIVNEKIQEDLPVDLAEMSLEDAKNCGAMGVFESKYGEKVKVYTIGPSTPDGRSLREPEGSSEPRMAGSREFFSREICGGPHVSHTGELGHFKILKEESSGAGVRRIKAVLE